MSMEVLHFYIITQSVLSSFTTPPTSASRNSFAFTSKYVFLFFSWSHSGNGLAQSAGGCLRFFHVVFWKCGRNRSSRLLASLTIISSAAFRSSAFSSKRTQLS